MRRATRMAGVFLALFLLLPAGTAWADQALPSVYGGAWGAHTHDEDYYRDKWCKDNGGKAEVTLSDKTRCDCLTSSHAVEFDWADKWAEAVGQSLHYGRLTGRTPAVVLILGGSDDNKYVDRVRELSNYYELGLEVWTMNEEK